MEMKEWVDGVEAKIVAVGTDVATVKETLSQLEQKMAIKPGASFSMSGKSFGAQVAESDQFKNWHDNRCQGSVKIELKAITSANAGTAWSDRDTDRKSVV